MKSPQLKVENININLLKPADYNPRVWSEEKQKLLKSSIEKHGFVDPLIVNGAEKRKYVVIGGHFRLKIAQDIGFTEVPVIFLDIPDAKKEKSLNLTLNKSLGDWDWDLLAKFDESLLIDVGFESEDLDDIFDMNTDEPENFDLKKA